MPELAPVTRTTFPANSGILPLSTLIKKKIKFSSYIRKIQNGAVVAKSYMTNGLLIYGEIFAHFLIY